MALLERLQILVDGNAQGAIREFQKVGAAADRELGRTEDKLNKISASLTSFGTGLIAGGAVAIAGLKTLADSASAYGEQVSAATVTFGEQGAAQLEKFAEAAADTANISKTEATKAANGFATFARQAGLSGTAAVKFSTDLVQLAGDISSFRDISVADALAALQSGLAGEGEPIRRLGGDISDVALKAEYLALTGEEVTGSLTAQQKIVAINSKLFKDFELAQGDVIRTQDSLANQTRNAQANFENLKTEVGEGLVPIFAKVVGGINDVITKFQELPEGTKSSVGTLAGIAGFGATAVGALSLVAGQTIKLRDAFTTVDAAGTRTLTNIGKGAAIAGGALGAAGLAVGILAIADAANQASINLVEVETALNRFGSATEPRDKAKQFQELAESLEGSGDAFYRVLTESLGQNEAAVLVGPEKLRVTLTNVDKALEDLFRQRDTEKLRDALDLLSAGEFVGSTDLFGLINVPSDAEQRFQGTLERYRGYLNSMGGEAEGAGEQLGGLAGQQTQVNEKTDEATDSYEQAKVALEKYDQQVAFLTVNYEALGKRADEFTAAIERSTRLDDEIESAASLGTALSDVRENIGALPKEIDTAKLAFGGYNEEQLKSIDALLKLGDASSQFLESLFQQSYTIDEIRFAAAILRDEYVKQFEQLGFNEEQIDNYLRILGLTPEQVDTAITLSGEEEARFKIEAYQALIEGTPPEKLTEFYAELAEGDYITAAQKLDELAKDRTAVVTIEQRIAVTQTVPGAAAATASAYDILAWRALGGDKAAAAALNALGAVGAAGGTGAGFPRMARGGPVMGGSPYIVGEEGPELFVPNTSGTIIPNNRMGGEVNQTFNITSPDPILTAAEVVRRQRDAEFLAGV